MSTTGGRSAAQVGSSLLGAPPGSRSLMLRAKTTCSGQSGIASPLGFLTRSHVRGYAPSTTNGYILGGNRRALDMADTAYPSHVRSLAKLESDIAAAEDELA